MVIFIDGNFVIVAIYLTNSIKGNSPSICHGYREERTHRERIIIQWKGNKTYTWKLKRELEIQIE